MDFKKFLKARDEAFVKCFLAAVAFLGLLWLTLFWYPENEQHPYQSIDIWFFVYLASTMLCLYLSFHFGYVFSQLTRERTHLEEVRDLLLEGPSDLYEKLYLAERNYSPVLQVLDYYGKKAIKRIYKKFLEEKSKRYEIRASDQNYTRITRQRYWDEAGKIQDFPTWKAAIQERELSKDISDETNRLNQQALSQVPSGS